MLLYSRFFDRLLNRPFPPPQSMTNQGGTLTVALTERGLDWETEGPEAVRKGGRGSEVHWSERFYPA
jgi:hypothetical protein